MSAMFSSRITQDFQICPRAEIHRVTHGLWYPITNAGCALGGDGVELLWSLGAIFKSKRILSLPFSVSLSLSHLSASKNSVSLCMSNWYSASTMFIGRLRWRTLF